MTSDSQDIRDLPGEGSSKATGNLDLIRRSNMPSRYAQQEVTLRFKQHKTTVLLSIDHSQSFSSIKQELIDALKSRDYHDTNGSSVPSDPENIMLGVPIDKNNIGKGWIALEIPEVEQGDVKNKGVKKGSVLNQNPLGAGLKDGAVLAFRFKSEEKDAMEVDDEWDVIMPSYDDQPAGEGGG